jgi:hypothetical protein
LRICFSPLICPDGANQFDRFVPTHLADPLLKDEKSPAPESQFRVRIQADWDFQSWPKNIAFRKLWYLPHIPPARGALAIVTNVGRDAVDAAARRASVIAGQVSARERSGSRKTSGAGCGRQNRVVLAPVAGVKSAEVRKPDRAGKTLIRWRR